MLVWAIQKAPAPLAMIAAIALVGCGDEIRDVASIQSPNGHVVATYKKYLFGGAAGGIGHCISISPIDERTERECPLLGSRVCIRQISWNGNELTVRYYNGMFTRITEKVLIKNRDDGAAETYYLQLVEHDEDGNCMSEWDKHSIE